MIGREGILVGEAVLVASTLSWLYGILGALEALSILATLLVGLLVLYVFERWEACSAVMVTAIATTMYLDLILGLVMLVVAVLMLTSRLMSRTASLLLLKASETIGSWRITLSTLPTLYLMLNSALGGKLAQTLILLFYLAMTLLLAKPGALTNARGINDLEVPYFSMLSASYSLFSKGSVILALDSIGREARRFFKGLYNLVYLKWRRDVEYLGVDPLDAFRYSSRRNDLLDRLAREYSIVVSSGGDESSFLFEKSESLLNELRDAWDWKVKSLTSLSEVVFVISVLTPLIATLSTLISIDPWLVVNVSLFSSIAACAASVVVSEAMRPPFTREFSISRELFAGLALVLATGFTLRSLQAPVQILLPSLTLALMLPVSARSLAEAIKARREERDLGLVLKELVEMSRGEPPGLHMLNKLRTRGHLQSRLKEAVKMLEGGKPVSAVVESIGLTAKHASLTLYLLLKLLELGGGIKALDSLSRFYYTVTSLLRRANRELAMPAVLAVIAAPLGLISLNMMASMVGAIGVASPVMGLAVATLPPGELRLYMSVILLSYSVALPKMLTGSFKAAHYSLPSLASLLLSMMLL